MAKSFFNVREENGAGDTGSDSLVNKYKSETPGQGESGEKKQKARKGDMLQNKDEPEKSLKTEEAELDEAKSFDQKFRNHLKFAMSDNPKVKDYLSKKVDQRKSDAAKRDPGATKKGYGPSVVDRQKAYQKAKKKGLPPMHRSSYSGGKRKLPESIELTEGLPTEKFQSAEAKLVAYAKKNGGIDKRDFLEIAKMCGQIGRVNILQAGQVLARLNRKIDGLDTDVREKVFEILKSVQLMESVELDEAKYTDKQIKMAYGIINDPRYKSGNMTAIVKKIEQIAKGLSKHPGVQKAIRVTNEDVEMVIDHLIAEQIEYLDENFEETSMMQNQIEAMEHFLDGIEEFVDNCEDCPEWFQNKLTMAFSQLQSLYSYAHGEMELDDESDDEEEMEESTKAYGDAMRKKASDRQQANMKPGEMDKLSKLRKMLDKEKK